MQSKVRLFGHPVHPMLVPFPIAFFTSTLVCAIVYISTKNVFWFKIEFIANCAGLIMAVVAVLPGVVDWLVIPTRSDAKATGMKHMIANAVQVGLFGANAAINYSYYNSPNPPVQSGLLISSFGFLVMLYAGFQGWKMVQTHHVGVDISSKEDVPQIGSAKPNTNVFEAARESKH